MTELKYIMREVGECCDTMVEMHLLEAMLLGVLAFIVGLAVGVFL